jgi:hypothetical protein
MTGLLHRQERAATGESRKAPPQALNATSLAADDAYRSRYFIVDGASSRGRIWAPLQRSTTL